MPRDGLQSRIEKYGLEAVAILSTGAIALGLLLPDRLSPAGGVWIAVGLLSLISALYARYEVLHQ